MPWMLPASVSILIATGILSVVYWYLYLTYRDQFLRYWAGASVFSALRYVSLIVQSLAGKHVVLVVGYYWATVAGAVLLIRGAQLFSSGKYSRSWTWVGIVGILWGFAAPVAGLSPPVAATPVFVLLALAYFQVGASFLRSAPKPRPPCLRLVVLLFFVWGAHQLDYPFLRFVDWFAPIGYLIGGSLAFATSIGMILLYFERTRSSLAASEERFRKVVDHAGDSLFLTDRAGLVVEVNDAACRGLGFSREELLGMKVGDFATRGGDQGEVTLDRLAGGDTLLVYGEHRRRDDSRFPVEVSVSSVSIGGESFVLRIARDVTESRRLMEEREALMQRLAQAQKLEALGTLTGGIAHDFNNILTAIAGYTELLLMEAPSGSSNREHLSTILGASARATDLVRGLLTFSRHSGEERRSIDLATAVKEVVKMVRPTIPATIEIRASIEEVGSVVAGPAHIQQILMNLCTNAYHAMREKGGVLSIGLRLAAPSELGDAGLREGPYARLSVQDTGVGMSQETLSRIYDPFYTTKAAEDGTGLGLSTVHGIVRGAGGAVVANSRVGEGTCFAVYLPLGSGHTETETPSGVDARGNGERVLVVDDEEPIRQMVSRMLDHLGYAAIACNSGWEALDLLSREGFEVLVTDQTMPGMTGLELIERARAVRPELRSVLCTGYSDQAGEGEARAAGARAFLMKPYSMSTLGATMRRLLDGG